MYIHIADSVHCTAENNTILLSTSAAIKNKTTPNKN